MNKFSEIDDRTPERIALDEAIASEPMSPPFTIPPDAVLRPMEDFLPPRNKPVAVHGVVENGVVRPLDPAVKLPERARVIIVANERV